MLVTEERLELRLPLVSDSRLWLWLKCDSDVEVIPDIGDCFSLWLELESTVAPVSDSDAPVETRTKDEELSCREIESVLDFEPLKSGSGCV